MNFFEIILIFLSWTYRSKLKNLGISALDSKNWLQLRRNSNEANWTKLCDKI